MPTWIHLTAHLSSIAPPLHHKDTGGWLWARLREAFPDALAVTLMPDHPHLVTRCVDVHAQQQRLARLLGHFGRSFGVRGPAARVAPPDEIRSVAALARHVRYVALNPCRAGLVRCPLAWPWSTHRDVIGACVDPWVSAARLAAALGVPRRGFEARHHAYVSGDPHANVAGTPMPRLAPSVDIATLPLQTVLDAVAAATRTDDIERSRELFVWLAIDQGWRQTGLLARVARCAPRTIQRHALHVDARALEHARLCAGDARLRQAPPSSDADRDISSA